MVYGGRWQIVVKQTDQIADMPLQKNVESVGYHTLKHLVYHTINILRPTGFFQRVIVYSEPDFQSLLSLAIQLERGSIPWHQQRTFPCMAPTQLGLNNISLRSRTVLFHALTTVICSFI